MTTILLTGGAGYIGSHIATVLIDNGYQVVIMDDLSNSNEVVIEHIHQISQKKPSLIKGDIRDRDCLFKIFRKNEINAVIHLAGLKSVANSSKVPLEYYSVNVEGTRNLIQAMSQFDCNKLVFSSSATVYGKMSAPPFSEDAPLGPTNPYGRTKLISEMLISDYVTSNPKFSAVNLRYFNPVGCHVSGLLGENPVGTPGNLFPFISQVAIGRRARVNVYGNDFQTKDGTGVRDYIHVMDLAQGHLKALRYLEQLEGCETFNLGLGIGVSVLEVLDEFSKTVDFEIPHKFCQQRAGDVAISVANSNKARQILQWESQYSLSEMCQHLWRWEQLRAGIA